MSRTIERIVIKINAERICALSNRDSSKDPIALSIIDELPGGDVYIQEDLVYLLREGLPVAIYRMSPRLTHFINNISISLSGEYVEYLERVG